MPNGGPPRRRGKSRPLRRSARKPSQPPRSQPRRSQPPRSQLRHSLLPRSAAAPEPRGRDAGCPAACVTEKYPYAERRNTGHGREHHRRVWRGDDGVPDRTRSCGSRSRAILVDTLGGRPVDQCDTGLIATRHFADSDLEGAERLPGGASASGLCVELRAGFGLHPVDFSALQAALWAAASRRKRKSRTRRTAAGDRNRSALRSSVRRRAATRALNKPCFGLPGSPAPAANRATFDKS